MLHDLNRSCQPAAAAAVMLLAAASAAPAQAAGAEFCVSCLSPDAHYVCAFDGVEMGSQDPRLKLLCITELAGKGGHASCSVDRAQKTPCQGQRMVLSTPDGLGPIVPVTPEVTDAPAASPQSPAAAGEAAGAPQMGDTGPARDAAAANPAPSNSPPSGGEPVAETTAPKSPAAAKETNPIEEIAEGASEGAAKAAKSAGSAMEKAGNAVGHAAKKTWECISTFFGSC
jgi:hypothetical protein